MWSKRNKLVISVCAFALILLTAAVTVFLLIPFHGAKNTMDPAGTLIIRALEEGTQLQWPEGTNATGYEVQVRAADGEVLHSARVDGCTAMIPALPEDREVQITVTSLRDYDGKTRKGSDDLTVTVNAPYPQVGNLSWQVDTVYDTVDMSFDMSGGDLCQIFVAVDGGEPVPAAEVRSGKCQLPFGADDAFPVPEYGQQLEITFRLERKTGNAVYEGPVTAGFTLTREDFLGRELIVEQISNGNNSYTFTWNETKGASYDVRLSEDGGKTWNTMAYIDADRERTYTTPCLKAFTDYTVSIVAVGGQVLDGSEFAAESEPIQITTAEKLLYSTIWPLQDQKVFNDTEETAELGTAPAGSAWCVLGMEGKYFKIRFQGYTGYINSDFCMINLPEYIGNLCMYDIRNSYNSAFMIHEYEIPEVSGTVIAGYENVRISEGQYLVPLLYPVTERLIRAALDARSRGYTLKIYESFRPQDATSDIYWKANGILGKTIPERTFSGKEVNDLHLVNGSPAKGDDPNAVYGKLTYRRVMTQNGAYSLGAFLAPGTSRHNFGVALDLTLVDSKGEELVMQTSIHDLSWYSSSARNNDGANILNQIMTGAGFWTIASEWWHFQDQQVYERNRLIPLKGGVSFECWVADGNGWRYRLSDGSFYANCTQEIEGVSYSFDENGYVVK